MKLVVFSIVLNEAETIEELISRIPRKLDGIDEVEILIISDGSTDGTAELAKKAGVHVVAGKSQKRLAYRFQQAMDECLKMGADIAVNIDGDLQFRPEEIPNLVKPILEEGFDFVAADRFTDRETGKVRKPKNMPIGKFYANRVGAWIVGKLSGYKFNDVTCGFRAYNRKAMLALNINSRYTYTQESFQILARKKFNITSVPVSIKYYPGRKSRVVTNFFKFLFGSLVNILKAFRDQTPLAFFGWMGLIPFGIGLAGALFLVWHWLVTEMITPYKAVGIASLYFLTMGVFIWCLGLVADMLERVNNNQEKILEYLKEIRFGA